MSVRLVDEHGPCRVCGDVAYSRDEHGFVHVGCEREGDGCRACAQSKTLARLQREREMTRAADREERREWRKGRR
jgi:hypothetical protein